MKSLIVSLMFLFAMPLWAAQLENQTPGNGGDVVDCTDKTELLDLYERNFPYKSEIYTANIPGDYQAKLSALLQRAANHISPYRAHKMAKQIEEFHQNITFVDHELEDIPDSQHIILRAGCKVRQLMIQRRVNGHSTLEISRPLWDKLDEDNKAAAFTHETFYAEAIDQGHRNSIPTRAMNNTFLDVSVWGDLISSRQAELGFPIEAVLPKGSVVIFPAYNSFGSTFARAKPGRYTEIENVCGLEMSNGFSIEPCRIFLKLKLNEAGEITQISTREEAKRATLDGTPWGVNAKLYSISLTTPSFTPAEPYKYVFDGNEYVCEAGRPIGMTPSSFTSGKGFQEPLQVQSCYGKIDRPFLPVRFTTKLKNIADRYLITFLYDSTPTPATPSGIIFAQASNKSPIWRLGFSLYDDFTFSQYREDWALNKMNLKSTGGNTHHLWMPNSSVPCELFSDVELYAGPRPSLAKGNFHEDPKCYFNLGGHNYQFSSVELDKEGHLIRGETQSKLPFAATTATFQGTAEFGPTSVKRGELKSPVAAKLQVGSATVATYLIPGFIYEQTSNWDVVRIVGQNRTISQDKNGNWVFGGDQYPIALFQDETKSAMQNSVVVRGRNVVVNARLRLLEGVLAEDSTLPVCQFDQESESFSIVTTRVWRDTRIKLRKTINSPADICYWTHEERR